MSVRFAIFAAASYMTCSIGASAPLIEETNGSGLAAGSHALVMSDLLTDPTETLAFKAVEFADPVVQLATRDDDASPRDAAVKLAAVTSAVTDGGSDPCPSAEGSACATEPRKDQTGAEAVAESAPSAPQTTVVGAASIALLCVGLAACLALGLGPIVRALSTHKQRKRWRTIKSRLVDGARGH